MKEDTELLDEVVVIGYGSMKKSDLTGSVTSIKSEDLMKTNPISINQGLQGVLQVCRLTRMMVLPEPG